MREQTYLILVSLLEGPLHGYRIITAVRLISDDSVWLRAGTLYGALSRCGAHRVRPAERSYPLLLRCFPAAFRTQFGGELLGALLELAQRGAVRQQVAEGIGLLGAGLALRGRGGATGTARLGSAGAAAAGTVSLLLLAAVGLVPALAAVGGSRQLRAGGGSAPPSLAGQG